MSERSKEEIEAMLKDYTDGISVSEIAAKYQISESSFQRVLNTSRGKADSNERKRDLKKIEKLEKTLKQRDKEIELLKAILKKSSS